MEAITKKYLDLYAALSGELQERPQLLNHYREAAYDAFARLGVPRFKSEDYQRTDLPSLFAEDWKLHVLDGAPYWASQAFAPEIFIGAFSDFVRLHPELTQEYYGRIAPIATDGLVALNTLFAAEALVIYVPRGAKIPGHIELSYILPRLAGHISVERALIISRMTLRQRFTSVTAPRRRSVLWRYAPSRSTSGVVPASRSSSVRSRPSECVYLLALRPSDAG